MCAQVVATPGAKMMYLIKRRATTSREELVAHWFKNHMPSSSPSRSARRSEANSTRGDTSPRSSTRTRPEVIPGMASPSSGGTGRCHNPTRRTGPSPPTPRRARRVQPGSATGDSGRTGIPRRHGGRGAARTRRRNGRDRRHSRATGQHARRPDHLPHTTRRAPIPGGRSRRPPQRGQVEPLEPARRLDHRLRTAARCGPMTMEVAERRLPRRPRPRTS